MIAFYVCTCASVFVGCLDATDHETRTYPGGEPACGRQARAHSIRAFLLYKCLAGGGYGKLQIGQQTLASSMTCRYHCIADVNHRPPTETIAARRKSSCQSKGIDVGG